MANGQTTGAALGDALAASTNTIMSFFLRKRQLDLQEQGLDQRRINDEQQIALGALRLLSQFPEPGTKVGDHAFLFEPVSFLLSDEGLESFKDATIPTRSSGQLDPVKALEAAFIGTLSPEAQLAFGEASVAKKVGEGTTTLEGVVAGQEVDRTSAVFTQAYAAALNNPDLSTQSALIRENTGRRAFGFDELLTVQLPDGSVVDITESAGNMNARFMQIRQTKDIFDQTDFRAVASGVALTLAEGGLAINPIDARRIAQAKLNGTLGELAASSPQLLPAIRIAAEASVGQLGNARLLLNQMGPRGAATNLQLDQLRDLFDKQIIDSQEFEEQLEVLYRQADNLSRANGFGRIMPTVETERILGFISLGDPQFSSFNPAELQPNQIDAVVSAFVSGRLTEEDFLSFELDESIVNTARAAKAAKDTTELTLFGTTNE